MPRLQGVVRGNLINPSCRPADNLTEHQRTGVLFPRRSLQKRPTVISSKPANGERPERRCSTASSPVQASLICSLLGQRLCQRASGVEFRPAVLSTVYHQLPQRNLLAHSSVRDAGQNLSTSPVAEVQSGTLAQSPLQRIAQCHLDL